MLNQSAISMRFGRMQSKRFLRGKDHAIFLARPWLNRRLVRIQFGKRIILLKMGFNTFLPCQILCYRTLIRQAGCFRTLKQPPPSACQCNYNDHLSSNGASGGGNLEGP